MLIPTASSGQNIAAAGFDPSTISGLIRWWDASDSIVGSVTGITDKSTTGSDLTAPVTAGSTTINGLSAVELDGTVGMRLQESTIDTSLLDGYSDFTLAWVIATDVAAQKTLGGNNSTSLTRGFVAANLTTPSDTFRFRVTNDVSSETLLFSSLSSPVLLVGTWDASTATPGGRVNGSTGSLDTAGLARTGATAGLSLGARVADETNTQILDVGEVLIWDNILSAGDITAVESYLATKWGVTI